MLQETLAEIGEALAEEGWGPQRKLRQICMSCSEFVLDNWATEFELSVLAAVEVPGKQTHAVELNLPFKEWGRLNGVLRSCGRANGRACYGGADGGRGN